MNRDTLNLAVLSLAFRDLTLLPLVLALSVLSALGIISASTRKIKKATDDYDAAMMADNGSGSAFAQQRARQAAARFYSIGPAPIALPPAQK